MSGHGFPSYIGWGSHGFMSGSMTNSSFGNEGVSSVEEKMVTDIKKDEYE